jgi:hypothetical protein
MQQQNSLPPKQHKANRKVEHFYTLFNFFAKPFITKFFELEKKLINLVSLN